MKHTGSSKLKKDMKWERWETVTLGRCSNRVYGRDEVDMSR